jgi:hypothetical protein
MDAASLAALFFDLVQPAHGKSGAASGLRNRRAGLPEFLDLMLEMKAKLFIEFFFDRTPSKQGAKAKQEIRQHFLPPVELR